MVFKHKQCIHINHANPFQAKFQLNHRNRVHFIKLSCFHKQWPVWQLPNSASELNLVLKISNYKAHPNNID